MSNSINILYTLSSNTFETTYISMFSVLQNNQECNIDFYIALINNLTEKQLSYLKKLEKHSNLNKFHFMYIDANNYLELQDRVYFTDRFYIFEAVEKFNVDKMLYLSSTTFVTGNILDLYNTNLTNVHAIASEYIYSQNISYKYNSKQVVFDPSVILVNASEWKKNDYLKKMQECQFLHDTTGKQNEVYCLNSIINNCKIVSLKYNYTEDYRNGNIQCSETAKASYNIYFMHLKTPTIITITGGSPLSGNISKNSYLNLWWQYAEKTEIYKDIKEYRNINKYKLSSTSAHNSFKYGWLLSKIWPYIKPYWFRILLGFVIAIPLGLLDGVTAFALKPYMDYVIGGKAFEFSYQGFNLSLSSIQMAFIIPVGVILFAAFQGILRYLNGYFSTWTSQRITNDVKFDLFDRLIHMHPQFFDDNSSGIVISRYMGDPGTASAGIVDNVKTITTSLCGALGLIAVMLYSSWKLAFIGVLVLCVAFIPVMLIRKRIKEASNKNMVIGGNITTNVNETYSGNKVMTAYALQDRQSEYFRNQVWKSFNINMSLYKRAGWMSPLMYLIASFGIATVLGVGTYLINSGQMTAGSFASFVTSLLLLYKPVKTLGNTLTGIQNIFVAMGRVFELFDLTPAIQEKENPVKLDGLNSSIEFKDVTFEYVLNNPILKNINLTIPKNQTLAIVGNSGGGKSTLVNLIPRFYDIKSGALTIDGIDIRNFSLNSLRSNISMVFQDNFLFSGTIKENIMMGNPDATVEELMEAIKSAHLQDMIQELPDGLDTLLGERGLTLSGGQRQRVAIARAMLRNAPIVILDEATSALDNESEAIVQKAMDNLMKDRTVFIIAHRLSTIKNADRIAVINEGELVELGTHEELMNIQDGQYKALYDMQFKRQEVKI